MYRDFIDEADFNRTLAILQSAGVWYRVVHGEVYVKDPEFAKLYNLNLAICGNPTAQPVR